MVKKFYVTKTIIFFSKFLVNNFYVFMFGEKILCNPIQTFRESKTLLFAGAKCYFRGNKMIHFFSMDFAWPREQFSILNVILNIKFILRENFAWNKMILSREQNVTFRGNKTLLFWKKFLRISWKKIFFFFLKIFHQSFWWTNFM